MILFPERTMTAKDIIQMLNLVPHPEEGGYYRETYRSIEMIDRTGLPERYCGARCLGTAIYFLLDAKTFSAFHRLPTDEIFHFYCGDPVELFLIHPDGRGEVRVIGNRLEQGELPQCVIQQGIWFGGLLRSGGEYALLGTTMGPGFEFTDYESGYHVSLLEQYPQHADWIRRLTR
jgi:predicted cupin superfamily sugar epimerase